MDFDWDVLVIDIRSAAMGEDPFGAVRAVLERTVARADEIAAAVGEIVDDEELLHEDDLVSIWRCRFQPDVIMPPHEHKMPVLIACYGGVEKSILYERSDGKLAETGRVSAAKGEVIELDEKTIHAVTADSGEPSDAIHVYFGPLMAVSRDLFDWDSGEPVAFSMENFQKMTRAKS